MLNMGVIGYGYWGPNIVRNFSSVDGIQVAAVSDRSPDMLKRAKKAYPALEVSTDPEFDTGLGHYRRGSGNHPGFHALRSGQKGPRERQARIRGEALHVDGRAGGRIGGARGQETSQDNGGPYIPLHGCGEEDQRALWTRALWANSIITTP